MTKSWRCLLYALYAQPILHFLHLFPLSFSLLRKMVLMHPAANDQRVLAHLLGQQVIKNYTKLALSLSLL